MNAVDYVIISVMVLAVALAVFLIVRRKRKGNLCCGSCSGCSDAQKKGGNGNKRANNGDKQNDRAFTRPADRH